MSAADEVKQQVLKALAHHESPECEVTFWDGSRHRFGEGSPGYRFTLHSPERTRELLSLPDLHLGELYMDGALTTDDDLRQLLLFVLWPMGDRLQTDEGLGAAIADIADKTRNTKWQAPENISHHYDVGNDFFRLWLDESMTYTCAYFERDGMSLEEAQLAKVDYVCRKLSLEPGDTLVDLGCGWGTLAMHAAEKYGARSLGVTLSKEQAGYAQEQIKRRGLAGRCEVRICDYRDVQGSFDKVSSVGMMEHVGAEYHQAMFDKIDSLLGNGGLALVHTIGVPYRRPPHPWLYKYIFPGYHMPTVREVSAVAESRRLKLLDFEDLRLHYQRTCDHWLERFEAKLSEVRALGYDERFIRMWRFYLASASDAFAGGGHQLFQFLFMKGLRNDLPLTRARWYRG